MKVFEDVQHSDIIAILRCDKRNKTVGLVQQVARTIHFVFTPLLFLPKWRLQLARTRDPNMALVTSGQQFSGTK